MADDDPDPGADVVLVGPELSSSGWAVLRQRSDKLEAGVMKPVRDGEPLAGGAELVRLQQRDEHPRLFDVDVLATIPTRTASGPPQVATDAYRAGWEMIFGNGKGGDLN
jgi:hypothetical protein